MRYVYVSSLFIRGLIAAVLLLYFRAFSFTQSYFIHHYSESNGLMSANVHDITQDHLGRMWFATRAGISVYDGVSWRNYTSSDGLPVAPFAKITVDQKGRVWAVAEIGQGGLYVVYHDGKPGGYFHSIKSLRIPSKSSRITSFLIVDNKQEQQDKLVLAVGTASLGLYLWNQEKWQQITRDHGLYSNSINGMVALDGTFYAATDKGLSIITPGSRGSRPTIDNLSSASLGLPPGSEAIKGITIECKDKYPDSHLDYSRILLFGRDWLGYFKENLSKVDFYQLAMMLIEEDKGVELLPDYRSGLYVGDKAIINYFDYRNLTWEPLRMSNGLISEGANAMFIDFEKNIWIACDRGISKISSRRFSNFQMKHGLLDDEVSAVLEYEPGKFILGHNIGITFYNENKKEFRINTLYRDTKSMLSVRSRVLDIQADAKGNIWLAVGYTGLAKINPHSPYRITWYDRSHGLNSPITSVLVDKMDRVWVGTGKGLFLLKGEKAVPRPIGEKISRPGVRRMFADKGRLRYIASGDEGLYVYDDRNNQWQQYQVPGDNNANSVFAVKKTSGGQVLVGTRAGLFILENDTLYKFKNNGFQLDRPVFVILEDSRHRLWFGTDDGVVRWNGTTARKYSTDDGLVGHETNRAAAIEDSRGRIWIGTNRSVSIYDETFDNNELFNPPPKIHLLDMEIQGSDERAPMTRKKNQNKPIRLDHQENTLTFHFRGISFGHETAIRFQSKLEGFEKDWSKESYHYNQMIRYINLSPGRYRFHIKVRNVQGVWSEVASSPQIIICAPFYNQWWFYLIGLLLLGAVFYSIMQFIAGKRYAALLEKQVAERTHQLQTAEQQYRNLFEESKDVVFISTPEGKLVDINPAGMELFGYRSREEALNILVITFYKNPSERAAFRKEIETKGFLKDYPLELKRKDGEPITVQLTATLVRDKAGKIVAYRGIIRDITRHKRLEQQLIQAQKMEAIGTLAGGIAHDFNNILGVIVGYIELALEDLPKEYPVRNNIEQVLIAAERAAELVKQILAFSRQTDRKRKPLHLSPVIKESLKLLRATLPATIEICHHIRVDFDSDLVLADATQVHQVMMNLCTNAAHAMQTGGGVLEVCLDDVYLDAESTVAYEDMQPGPYLRLVVSDTGHGIPEVVKKRIFEPYFTTKNLGEGTGMGLAVIHGIVKSHGGDITVYSEPGKGSAFHVYLPRMEKGKEEAKFRLEEETSGGSECILLAEDEEALLEVSIQMMERMGYEVVGKSNPIEALEIFRSEPDRFDLVITDLTMPNISGLQLAKEVKRIKPGIPIILCSGYSTTIIKEEIKAIGVNDFVMKPIIKSELARVVRQVLDERKE
ncbi:MAG: response regulator [Candidatus Aminicenantes bacterium]|nr:response regulator [Candidatus Aminicenantes bacterium]NIM83770.1 response regulator [Candidatus Aminicenantes bacterium]NIN23230.1 response regulator [Candidatus Aminicenantes bacterium]NIN46924.1 response regulator [Candidatus Aminicenantes bacterium]NIN89846.1 response regulator [Candidatus Aminicenantes bacterium]